MFNRTFLHFVVGFCLLVLLGMAGIVGANYFDIHQSFPPTPASSTQ